MEFTKHYLTYAEYKGLGGTLEETPFNLLEYEAQKNIDKYTFGRLKELDTKLQETTICDYELINKLDSYAKSNSIDANVQSENTDGYSVTYAGISSELIKGKESEIKSIIKTYLAECKLDDGTPYLYIGV